MNPPDKNNYLLACVRGWIDPKRKGIWNHSHLGAQVRCFGHDLVSNRAGDREQPRDMGSRLLQITGQPQAWASIIGQPKPSKRDG